MISKRDLQYAIKEKDRELTELRAVSDELAGALDGAMQFLYAWRPEYPMANEPQRVRVEEQISKSLAALQRHRGEKEDG